MLIGKAELQLKELIMSDQTCQHRGRKIKDVFEVSLSSLHLVIGTNAL